MKIKIFTGLTFLLILTGALYYVVKTPESHTKELEESKHVFITSEEFNKLNRLEQVQLCGSCHKEIYQNEQQGPHANSYLKLAEHVELVNSDAYTLQGYKDLINKSQKRCLACHAGDNLFEKVEIYKEAIHDAESADNKIALSTNTADFLPPSKKELLSIKTGVDCITCHYDGKAVVASVGSTGSKKDDCPEYCQPSTSSFFASNNNCIACHYENVKTMVASLGSTQIESTSCNSSCHQEYNKAGKATHYYYWLHDPEDKKREQVLGGLFEGISVTYSVAKDLVSIEWFNYFLPHAMNDCREFIAYIEALNNDGEILSAIDLRINRKDHTDKRMKRFFPDQDIPGVQGQLLNYDGTPLVNKLLLEKGNKPRKIRITGSYKTQYWLDDSLSVKVYKREIIL